MALRLSEVSWQRAFGRCWSVSFGERALRVFGALLLLTCCLLALNVSGQERVPHGYVVDTPTWRFVFPNRPVKAVLMAGSIGAYPDEPYARVLNNWCSQVEIRNLSRVGQGASQLYFRFRDEVLRRRRWLVTDGQPLWLIWNGGLNSVGSSYRTNRYIRRSFVEAHAQGMRVMGLTLSPWGSESERRFLRTSAIDTMTHTRRIVDYVMGRNSPSEALGNFVSDHGTSSTWAPNELADIRVDLFDSVLRNRSAPVRDTAMAERWLAADRSRTRMLSALPEPTRAERRSQWVREMAELPRWFLRPEYRGFDSIHPNREGHRQIALATCRQAPPEWACQCPAR